MADDEVLNRAAEVNEQFRPIELSAETVTRPAGTHTPTVHAFLRHLRDQGLDCVPEPLSLGGRTETLRFIEGESGGDGWRHQHDERGLRSAARLLRRIHDASVGWDPPKDAVFAVPPVEGGDTFVNGDPGPWNFVWRDGEAVALIDWDFLHPAPRLSDVAYALHWFAPLRDDRAALEWHHFPEVPDRRTRVEVFLEAYDMVADFDVVDAVVERIHRTSDHVRFLAAQGQEPQRTWLEEGSVERERQAEIAWIEANRGMFSR
ncbi:aminoglycoside phosphotransferase family protein [Nocardioides KLBMP 9356]|uniref:Aminoglycoside phosphotransferase family protein n=1 Tax=Nocardioides potassii TaxID=2911371 RepID=A0ABS9HD08_9ACTN|nr:aminoglycoside phosphotransferase family protein [Nocardioides potassii]MCF6379072.1 aminoglycoside phosphotransferase family protein [Nocardioides potassii]